MDKLYEIVTNRNGRRILVIKKPVDMNNEDQVGYKDFDAVYLEYTHNYVVDITVIWNNLPMFSDKTWLKPFFLSTLFNDRFSKYAAVVDGFANSPQDMKMDARITEIEDNIIKSGISRERTPVSQHEDLFINFCKFCVSRGNLTVSNSSIKYYARGYTSIISTLFGENDFIDKRLNFEQNLLNNGYITKKRFVDKIYLCPTCRDSHLIFIESCPKCKSSNLREEQVIHHFRCANISPESTYEFDGELRCPKCKKFLRHIGVDYDVPASVYTCSECSHSFVNPTMKVLCTHCHREMTPETLSDINIEEYEFTQEGLNALVTDEMRLNMRRSAFDGYSDYDNFISTMRIMANANSRKSNFVVMVARITLTGESNKLTEMQSMLIQPLLYNLPSFKYTIKGEHLYIMQSTDENDCDSKALKIRECVNDALTSLFGKEITSKYIFKIFIRRNEDRTVDFVKLLESNN